MKKQTDVMNHIPPAMWEAAERMLAERGLVPVAEFDTEIAELAASVPQAAATGAGRNRRMNLCDHIKANWTKAGRIRYARINRTDYIIWLPSVGHVNGIALAEHARVVALVRALLRASGTGDLLR